MGNLLDSPNTGKDSESYYSSSGLRVGSSGMQGWRLEMEDSHVALDMPSRPDHTFFAVFDGHGGPGAAAYAASNIIRFIEDTRFWREYIKGGASDIALLQKALTQSFLDIDVALRDFQGQVDSKDTSGTTSVTAMITPNYIICANAGDSRCVMGTNNEAKAMSEDHKPNNPSELKRVELAGGKVHWKRIDGDLAVSRGFGDFQYKTRPDLPQEEQKVSCEPEFIIHDRCAEDEMLLLACDGLWDVMSNEEAVTKIREIFANGGSDMVLVAEEMLTFALEKGSKDNISAVLVQLPGAKIDLSENNIRIPSSHDNLSPQERSHRESKHDDSKDDDEVDADMGSPQDRNL